jgi:hypothetical protein
MGDVIATCCLASGRDKAPRTMHAGMTRSLEHATAMQRAADAFPDGIPAELYADDHHELGRAPAYRETS